MDGVEQINDEEQINDVICPIYWIVVLNSSLKIVKIVHCASFVWKRRISGDSFRPGVKLPSIVSVLGGFYSLLRFSVIKRGCGRLFLKSCKNSANIMRTLQWKRTPKAQCYQILVTEIHQFHCKHRINVLKVLYTV